MEWGAHGSADATATSLSHALKILNDEFTITVLVYPGFPGREA